MGPLVCFLGVWGVVLAVCFLVLLRDRESLRILRRLLLSPFICSIGLHPFHRKGTLNVTLQSADTSAD